LIKIIRKLIKVIRFLYFAVASVIICLVLLGLYPFVTIWKWLSLGFWLAFGKYGTHQINGIEVSTPGGKLIQTITWDKIHKLSQVYYPPFFKFEILLKTNSIVKIDFIDRDELSSILADLKLRNIQYEEQFNL
jgi:hypothetical protein